MFLNLDSMFLSRFDGQTKLLVRSLLSGASGSRRAPSVFQRQQRSDPPLSLHSFILTLCQEELCPETETQPLTVKPLVCLFPASFKQNLLSFIHLVSSALPRTGVLHLLECLSWEPCPNPWVTALVRQLERDLGAPGEKPLYSPLCSQRLNMLSERLVGAGRAGGWAECFSGQKAASASQGASGLLGTQRKRKSSFVAPDSDAEETGQQSKRIKVDSSPVEGVGERPAAEERGVREETSGRLGDVHTEASAEELKPAADDLCDALSEHMKVSIPQIKELLESQTEWDQSATDVFKVLNECDPAQVEVLCSMLSLPDIPEQTLPKLCSSLLALSPDLSYSAAATLIKSLLLGKVRSLSEPASRCLVTAVTSLCSRYPRPTCHALIGPVLEEKNIGNPQAELLNRLIGDCLEPHYRLLVLQMTFRIVWSEAVLSIIHSLLDSKPELNEELFTHFTEHLVSQAPQFTKSMKFAKMMLTVLTKYNSHVTAAHKHSLSGCLALNETFLKKSLQAALKRITHT
uniref:Fanconi anemia group E protein n=1 Tax=Centroberyx gerrardi TaxID=166262 RepID=UPI003AB08F83